VYDGSAQDLRKLPPISRYDYDRCAWWAAEQGVADLSAKLDVRDPLQVAMENIHPHPRSLVAIVRHLMVTGVDPNFERYPYLEPKKAQAELLYPAQPTTPLKHAMFNVAESRLTQFQIDTVQTVTELLLAHGADPFPAMALAEGRYGQYTTESCRWQAWHFVAVAAREDEAELLRDELDAEARRIRNFGPQQDGPEKENALADLAAREEVLRGKQLALAQLQGEVGTVNPRLKSPAFQKRQADFQQSHPPNVHQLMQH